MTFLQLYEVNFQRHKRGHYMLEQYELKESKFFNMIVCSCYHCKTSLRDGEISAMFLLFVKEKFIGRLETKMTDVDPSAVWQHAQPLKNNYFKACNCVNQKTNFQIMLIRKNVSYPLVKICLLQIQHALSFCHETTNFL